MPTPLEASSYAHMAHAARTADGARTRSQDESMDTFATAQADVDAAIDALEDAEESSDGKCFRAAGKVRRSFLRHFPHQE